MSDTEVKRRMSEDSGSSSDQDTGPEQVQNLREDGEPLNRPRKDSTSSSSEEEGQDEQIEDTSSSIAISKSLSQGQTSSSESAKVISKKEEDSSSSDTDEDVSKKEMEEEEEDERSSNAPVPAIRKVSAPTAELTQEEVELSKRETVALKDSSDSEEEVEEEKAEVSQVQVNVEEVSDDEQSQEAAVEPPKGEMVEPVTKEETVVVEQQATTEPEIKRPQFRHSASSSSDEEIIPDQQTSHIKGANSSCERALDERKEQLFAASVSPVPPPASQSPVPSRANASNLTKIYTDSLEQNNNNNIDEDKAARVKPSKDITSIYTKAVAKSYTPPSSPKPMPSRNRDITQLYTGQGKENGHNGPSPCIAADKLNPKKHNMSTAVDKDAIRRAYEDVRSDGSDTQWAVFKFDGNNLKFSGSGADFKDFKASFSNEDRGFGYIRINTGDEMSKRAKFVFVTWVGPSVSVMKKAKMSTDKALMKDIIQNMSVELQFENHSEFSHDHFKSQVDKAAGARYGTGERAL